jgi:gamma-glutamylcyclotransferase (GGCT)/AIG2-like uncharacterized protein YtfP
MARIFDTEAWGLRGKLSAARELRVLFARLRCERNPASHRFAMNASIAPTPAPPQRYVAVYGTLRKGGSNDIHRFTPPARYVGTATLRGTLHHMGPYPGLVLAREPGQGGDVIAEVYAVCPALEAALDELEAAPPSSPDEYFKQELNLVVTTATGVLDVNCFVYEVNPLKVRHCPVIADGDWIAAVSPSRHTK